MFQWLRKRKRAHFSPAGPALGPVLQSLPLWAMLPAQDQAELAQLVPRFLARKSIEACGGLVLTQAMCVAIAANACLLLLRRKHDLFPHMGTVLLYPAAYVAQHTQVHEGGLEEQRKDVLLGESWQRGNVVLSWQDVALDCANIDDGFNVTLHEFAHQLDAENGAMDGAPSLPAGLAKPWADTMAAEYAALCARAESEPAPDSATESAAECADSDAADWVLDPYGAEDPAEFFAVATEAFFEDSPGLKDRHPAVYSLLAQYFNQDPASWPGWSGQAP